VIIVGHLLAWPHPHIPMAVSYMIVDNMILIVLAGVVNDRELLEAQTDLFDNPAFRGELPRLVDATGVAEMRLSAAMVRHLAHSAYDRGLRRSALVANDMDLVYGLMRMYAAYTGDAEVEVFRDREAALEWLLQTSWTKNTGNLNESERRE
jgi:hypothetical protein